MPAPGRPIKNKFAANLSRTEAEVRWGWPGRVGWTAAEARAADLSARARQRRNEKISSELANAHAGRVVIKARRIRGALTKGTRSSSEDIYSRGCHRLARMVASNVPRSPGARSAATLDSTSDEHECALRQNNSHYRNYNNGYTLLSCKIALNLH